jgi:hypothetical protein
MTTLTLLISWPEIRFDPDRPWVSRVVGEKVKPHTLRLDRVTLRRVGDTLRISANVAPDDWIGVDWDRIRNPDEVLPFIQQEQP